MPMHSHQGGGDWVQITRFARGCQNKATYLGLGNRDKVVEHSTSIRRVEIGCIQVCIRERSAYD